MNEGSLRIESIECVADVKAVLGEGPLWDPRVARLLFVDIKGEKIFLYDPASRSTQTFAAPGMVSAVALASEGYICARRDGFARLSICDGAAAFVAIADPEVDRPGNRFNDGKLDPHGGFWAGTMDMAEKDATAGAWWRLSPDGGVQKIDDGYHVTNGPAFNEAGGRVYLTDSARQTVFTARFEGGALCEKQTFLQFETGDGYPDGMEVDVEGCLWIAFWDGAAVRRFSPQGELILEVALPVPRPTSVAFVDNRIYVTSARVGLCAADLERAPMSGGLFEIKVNTPLSINTAPRVFQL